MVSLLQNDWNDKEDLPKGQNGSYWWEKKEKHSVIEARRALFTFNAVVWVYITMLQIDDSKWLFQR